jgi:hypothetical protein
VGFVRGGNGGLGCFCPDCLDYIAGETERLGCPENEMNKSLFSRNWFWIVLFLIGEVLSIGMGMGVPFFTILFGFLVGWIAPRFIQLPEALNPQHLRSMLKYALVTSAVSTLILGGIWLPTLKWLFDPSLDLANFGIPMILYTPRASFIGWIILMVLISPFLQFLMTLFGTICRKVFFPRTEY